jgi:hypothetical protein
VVQKHVNGTEEKDNTGYFVDQNGVHPAAKQAEISVKQPGIETKPGQKQGKEATGHNPVQDPFTGPETLNIFIHGHPP